jgi:hypothetical protein
MMNQADANQQRRTIKVKDFLDDFHSGMSDSELLTKYHLTEPGLEKFFSMLVDRKIISSQELALRRHEPGGAGRSSGTREDVSGIACPSCGGAIETEFDICPHCGVFVADPGATPSAFTKGSRPEKSSSEREAEPFFPWRSSAGAACEAPNRSDDFTGGGPIEIPLTEEPRKGFKDVTEGAAERFKGLFRSVKPDRNDAEDEVVPGLPLDIASREGEGPDHGDAPHCIACDAPMREAVRNVYDRRSGLRGAMISAVLFMAGLLGAIGLAFCEGYSAARLLLIYVTGLSMLSGACMAALSVFMLFLAKEKVTVCDECHRIQPSL